MCCQYHLQTYLSILQQHNIKPVLLLAREESVHELMYFNRKNELLSLFQKKKKKSNPGKLFFLALKKSNSLVAFWSSKINRALPYSNVTYSLAFRRCYELPTRSLGMSRRSEPCFRNTFPAVCAGFIPIPSFVIMALVAAGTLNSSAANLRTAVKGVLSGTLNTL